MRKRIYISLMILACMVIVSCGMFGTREPENPTGNSNLGDQFADPGEVLANIENSFQFKDGIQYMKSFAQPGYSDSAFSFEPDFSSPNYNSAVFEGWGYDSELSFILMLFSPDFLPPDSLCAFEFIPESEPPELTLPIYREQYILEIHHTNSNLPTEFSGRANIQFDQNSNLDWVVISWSDESISGSHSITELKSAISN